MDSVGIDTLPLCVPFLILLMQGHFKRKRKRLAAIAMFILFMRLVDMFCLIRPEPAYRRSCKLSVPFGVSWMDIVAPLAVGGIWVW